MTNCQPDVVVIGAGPAGLAAAGTAAQHGLHVTLLDEQPEAGGQIYRTLGSAPPALRSILGSDYVAGESLLEALNEVGVTYVPDATVWQVEAGSSVFYSCGGNAFRLASKQVIIATGAVERAMPFAGWTKPGVMTAGAAQILLKTSAVAPDGKVVLAGNGPLLLLLASQYLRAGVEIAAIVDTTDPANCLSAAPLLPKALLAPEYLWKGLKLILETRRANLRNYANATKFRALGESKVEAFEFYVGGQRHEVDCDTLIVHQGVVPNVQMSRALGVEHTWNERNRCWDPVTGDYGETNVQGVVLAGDGQGIGGAQAAAYRGELAGLYAARQAHKLDSSALKRQAASARDAVNRQLAIRPFLDELYQPLDEFLTPADDTLVCRCEEVSAGDLREFAALGALGPNQAKAYGRCGMGPCQGRVCGLVVSEVLADALDTTPSEVGYYRIRPPIKPVTLGEVASLDDSDGLAETGRML